MTADSSFDSPSIHHEPLGEQHPYSPLPYERSPRFPCAGEKVTLGIETGKTPPANAVWCSWWVERAASVHRADADPCIGDEMSDRWQIELPPFQPYEIIHYRIFAEHVGRRSESEEFSFSVSAWEEVTGAIACEASTGKLVMTLATTRQGLFLRCQVEFSPIGTVSFTFTTLPPYANKQAVTIPAMPGAAENYGLRFQIRDDPFQMQLTRVGDGMRLLGSGPIRVLVSAAATVLKYRLGFTSPPDEAFYGFGERFNALDQRGNHLDNYVFHQYTGQGKRTYIPIPFFISSRGYGLWLQTERQAGFDLAASQNDRWVLTGNAEDELARLELRLLLQPDPHAIMQALTDLVGKPKLPPDWAFGLWMSSNDWNDQAEVLRQLRRTQEENIPATVLVIEAWSDEINFYIWNDAEYDLGPSSQAYRLNDFKFPHQGRWPDPKAMVDEIHQAGMRLVLWQNPLIKQNAPHEHLDERLNQADQEFAIQHDYVVKRADGTPYRVAAHAPWFVGSLVLDFTNPQATAWWFSKREYLLSEIGVDGFKTDGGEHIWDEATRFFNGMHGSRGINYFPVAYESAYQRYMQEHHGDGHVLFSRAGYTGAQLYPCHWAGDEKSTWDAFRATVRALLNVGLCGVPFVGWDIAGFSGPIPSSELYLRATAFSVFCPIMQYHSDVNHRNIPSRDRTPWNIQEQTGDKDVVPIFRMFANLRMNILPYILGQARASCRSGLPLMRALSLEYPDDLLARKYPFEYMFGDALLVAPVVEEGVSVWPVYLPAGEWRELLTGEHYHGPAELVLDAPRDRLPLFQIKGSILPLNLDGSGELGSPVGNSTTEFYSLTLQIFPKGELEASLVQFKYEVQVKVIEELFDDGSLLTVLLPPLVKPVELVIFGRQPSSVVIGDTLLPRVESKEQLQLRQGWYWDYQAHATRIGLEGDHAARRVVIK